MGKQYCFLVAKKEDYRSFFYRFFIKTVMRSVFLRILIVIERGVSCAIGREMARTMRSWLGLTRFALFLRICHEEKSDDCRSYLRIGVGGRVPRRFARRRRSRERRNFRACRRVYRRCDVARVVRFSPRRGPASF